MNAEKVIRKRNLILVLFFIILAMIVTGLILINVKITDENNKSLYLLILMIFALAIALYFRSVLYGYNNMVRIGRLVQNQSKPLPFEKDVTAHPEIFYQKDFKLHSNTNDYTVLYKHVVDNSIKIKKFNKLYIVLLIKNPRLDFYNKLMHEDIEKLENTFTKKMFPNKYIITAYKTVNEVDKQLISEIGEVVCYNNNRQHYVQINVGLSKKDNLAYFLYSDTFKPNLFYDEAVQSIKSVIKK